MLSQTSEYALRAVVFLAASNGKPQTSEQISHATHVRWQYLSKVMQALRRAQLVAARPGTGGGFILTRAAEELTVFDVVAAIEPLRRIQTCPLGLVSHRAQLCPLHAHLDSAMHLVQRAFGSMTIKALLRQQPQPRRCPFPAQA